MSIARLLRHPRVLNGDNTVAISVMRWPTLRFALACFVCLSIGQAYGLAEEQRLLDFPVVVATSSAPDVFPKSWRSAPISATGEILAESEFERVRGILKHAISKYPNNVLSQHLKQVFVLSELKYSGVTTSGTNSASKVYLKIGNVQRGFTDEWIERVFHAEFSSILLRIRGLDDKAWCQHNPPDFQYLGSGVDAIKQKKHSVRFDQQLHELGFLSDYSKSTLENDFNAIVASLFVGDKRLWDLAKEFPRLKGKLDLTIAFYGALDPTLTEAKFRSFVPL
jgi:hypothetical protein